MICKLSIIILLIFMSTTWISAEPEADITLQDIEESGDVKLPEKSFRQEIVNSINNIFSPELTVFIISMLPIFELRLSIPIGILTFGLNPLLVFILSIIGNMVPIFFILLFLGFITRIFNKVPILRRFLEWLFQRTQSRSKIVEKYQELGLVVFVAIPLPVTGAWTGSVAAYLLGLDFWKSIFFIFCGVIIAGIVVTILSLLGWWGGIIALTVLLSLFLRKALSLKNKNKKDRGREGSIK